METTPSSYYLTPLLTVDMVNGQNIAPADAYAEISAGRAVTVLKPAVAHQVLRLLGLSDLQARQSMSFGQTGKL